MDVTNFISMQIAGIKRKKELSKVQQCDIPINTEKKFNVNNNNN